MSSENLRLPTPSFIATARKARIMAAITAPHKAGKNSDMMTIIASGELISPALNARSATCGLNIKPGLATDPHVPRKTAAPAMTGGTPRAIKAGIRRTPTAAAIPTADGRTMFKNHVMMTAPGITSMGTLAKGRTRALTKWSEHLV